MFENFTFEYIMEQLLEKVDDTIDKRESGIVYNALAPAALELENAYANLDTIVDEGFADSASYEYLVRRAAEKGIYPKLATYALLKMVTTPSALEIETSARFMCDDLYYNVVEKLSDGVYSVQCETEGTEGNAHMGETIAIDFVEGLETATITEVIIPAINDEDEEVFRNRYFNSITTDAFGGNKADYIKKTDSLDGVGATKVIPTWNGGGTVKLVILNNNYGVPSTELVSSVQEQIDPTQTGSGDGIAPIGHVVTVVGASTTTINVTTTVALRSGMAWEDVSTTIEEVITGYFTELAKTFEDTETIEVRISQIEYRILNIDGIIDVQHTALNGSEENISITDNSIPVKGTVSQNG